MKKKQWAVRQGDVCIYKCEEVPNNEVSKNTLTENRLKELLDYKPETGEFIHRQWRGGITKIGGIAGSINSAGYRLIKVDGVKYPASRLAFLWMTGNWPDQQIDHINRNRADDRWGNLRSVSHGQNMRNRSLPRIDKSIPQGVTPHKDKWRAKFSNNGKTAYLGLYNTKEEAAKAYQLAVHQSGDIVLAHGEATGHSHRIINGNAELFVKAELGLMYLKVLDRAELYHDEHESICLDEGSYEIKIQREFDWFNEEVRRVVD